MYDSEAVPVTGIEYVSNGLYKVYCDISDKTRGVTVVNKKSTLLTTSNGYMLPVFSVIFYVEGLDTYIRRAYVYENVELCCTSELAISDVETTDFNEYILRATASDLIEDWLSLNVSESVNISYWTT